MKQDNCYLSIIAPVFNEDSVIAVFVDELYKQLSKLESSYEVVLVDDGSSDGSVNTIKKLQTKYPFLKLISFTRNFGHQHALWAGIERAIGSAVIMMDSDLQHPPSIIPMLVERWKSGSIVVQTIRKNVGTSLTKRTCSKCFYFFVNLLSSVKLDPATADFRLVDRVIIRELLKFKESDIFLRGLIPWLGFKTDYVQFDVAPRFAGNTKYSFFKMFKFAITGITSLSSLPLRCTTIVGFLISLVSFYFGTEAIYMRMFTDRATAGWASVMVGVFFIGGLSMIFMGILGEYLGKIFMEVKRRPKFIVREAIGFDENE